MQAAHKTCIEHATFSYDDERNQARTVRGIGFRGRCSCGEASRPLASVGMARGWLREHALTHRAGEEREAVSATNGTESC